MSSAADRRNFRRLVIGFLIMCTLSGFMHVYLVGRGVIKPYRMKPNYQVEEKQTNPEFLKQGEAVVGVISAVSYDKFYVKLESKNQQFLRGQLTPPEVGTRVKVIFAQGTPPVALKVEPVEGQDG